MKKILSIGTLLLILIAFAGCGSSTPSQKTEGNTTTPGVNTMTPAVNTMTPAGGSTMNPTYPREGNVTPAPGQTPKQ